MNLAKCGRYCAEDELNDDPSRDGFTTLVVPVTLQPWRCTQRLRQLACHGANTGQAHARTKRIVHTITSRGIIEPNSRRKFGAVVSNLLSRRLAWSPPAEVAGRKSVRRVKRTTVHRKLRHRSPAVAEFFQLLATSHVEAD